MALAAGGAGGGTEALRGVELAGGGTEALRFAGLAGGGGGAEGRAGAPLGRFAGGIPAIVAFFFLFAGFSGAPSAPGGGGGTEGWDGTPSASSSSSSRRTSMVDSARFSSAIYAHDARWGVQNTGEIPAVRAFPARSET